MIALQPVNDRIDAQQATRAKTAPRVSRPRSTPAAPPTLSSSTTKEIKTGLEAQMSLSPAALPKAESVSVMRPLQRIAVDSADSWRATAAQTSLLPVGTARKDTACKDTAHKERVRQQADTHRRAMPLRLRRGFLLLLGIVTTALLLLVLNVRTVQAADAIHVVSPGDSLAAIAIANNLTLRELSEYNGIDNPNHIVIGQQIRVPASTAAILSAPAGDLDHLPGGDGYYVIQQGDSLSHIARAFGMSQGDLMRLNGLDNANRIFVGQTLRLTARVPAPATWGEQRPQLADAIHVVREGDSLAAIAQEHNTNLTDLMTLNGLPNANFIYVGQRLRLKTPASAETAFNVAGAPADGRRRISIDLTRQTLTAYQGDVVVMHTSVSTGKPETPTVTGTFEIGIKYESQRMYGPGYDLPGVPWVMYFFRDYAIHGAYWHMNWGTPMSRGCVNMRPEEARMLYEWAAPGTEVTVHY